ncbi:hypothetical protein K490DRAFT_64604 [Saccharata proteae CBS 121410]|uniref:Apple domain-containing protein n=1 Tax=Saccharata proteae CBS 121410 TaxID=1314787 RepID=A0A9P4HY09_9PEZI|nr:hypothetical protein K490DRAFT_64604 [Saccharata proteae CBS 121410]
MQCSHNLPGSNIVNSSALGDSVNDCMEQCSRLRPLCYGTSFFSETGRCFFKDSTVSGDDLTSNTTVHSAIAQASELSPTALSNVCPFPNDTVQSTDSGMQYRVLCGFDDFEKTSAFCPQENPMGEVSASNTSCRYWHADTLQGCAQWCSTLHPLCLGVTFNPDMGDGFANCYPKNNLSVGLGVFQEKNGKQHFALTILNETGAACPNYQSYTSNTGGSFQLSCNQDRADNTMIAYHDNNLDSCIDTCGTSPGCVGVVYDSNLDDGFMNCYLKNATGVPTTKANSTFALLTSSASSTASPSRGSSSSSSAWIAGAVIGGLAGVVLVVGAILAFTRCRRRRQSRRRSSGADSNDSSGRGAMPLVQIGGRAHVALEAENSEIVEIGEHAGEEPKELAGSENKDGASEAFKRAAAVAAVELAGSEVGRREVG